MNSLSEFFSRLFDSSDFNPRNTCGMGWNETLVRMHQISDFLIWLSYMAIPVVLIYFVRKRRDVPFTHVFWLFGVFILSCGLTHLVGMFMFQYPMYRLDALIKMLTALASVVTVIALIPITPRVLALRSPHELEAEIVVRKKAEMDLFEVNNTLERRVAERTEQSETQANELREMNERLQKSLEQERKSEEQRRSLERQIQHAQRLESLGVLAGGIAHDFNNLLTGIMGNADLALLSMSPSAPARPYVDDVKRTGVRLADLTQQMLAYSGKGRFVVLSINLNEAIEEMSHLLKTVISKRVTLKFNFSSQLPTIRGDAPQIRQVIMNLITNASESIREKDGIVTISTGVITVDQEFLNTVFLNDGLTPGKYVYLEVNDTGCGMDVLTMEKIFDPFFTTKFTGRGLGLAAVLGIVRGHKGAIKVYSQPDRGSTFKVVLPADECAEETERKTVFLEPASDNQGETVLVIDDEETVRQVVQKMLQSQGYRVICARDGEEGLEIYKKRHLEISMVMLDLTMPKLSGEETLRELQSINPKVQVLLTSGYNEQEISNRFVGRGLAGFIQKPFERVNLLLQVARVRKGLRAQQ